MTSTVFASQAALPGFKATCTTVSVLYVLLSLLNLAQGADAILASFDFPDAVVGSPLFRDFFHWLFVHMLTIGVLIGVIGRCVVEPKQQRLAARILLLLELHYCYLDVRTSIWGSRLYDHPKSLVPVAVDLLVAAAFAVLSLRRLPTLSVEGTRTR